MRQGLLLAIEPTVEGFGRPAATHQRRAQALGQEGITQRGGVAGHQQTLGRRPTAMQWMMAIPDAQAAVLAPAGVGGQAEAGQQGRQHRLGIGLLLADERAHTDAPAPLPREGPAEAVMHQAEFKTSRIRLAEAGLHLDGDRGGIAGTRRTQPMGHGQAGARTISDQHRGGAELLAIPEAHPPEPLAPLQADDISSMAQLRARLDRPIRQELIEHRPAHDPERCIPGQLRHNGVLQTPGEAHPPDHLVDSGAQIKGKPALHRGRHATTARFRAAWRLALQQQHPPAPLGQVKGRRSTGYPRTDNNDVSLSHRSELSAHLRP